MMRDISAYFYYVKKQHMNTGIAKTSAKNISLMSQFTVHGYLTIDD